MVTEMGISEKLLFVQEKPNSYVLFIPPDMSSVKFFRKELRRSLLANHFTEENTSQIVLASDEALTNSISANISNDSQETIICRWRIEDARFLLYILDYGKGLKMQDSMQKTSAVCDPHSSFADFIHSLKSYQKSTPGKMPYSGKEKIHRNMGQGLRIIHTLMDTVKIMYHSNDEIHEKIENHKINGSIVELKFDTKKHPNEEE
ncbi:MAG: ATP-binding protein [Spirochaetota bacterium]